MVGPIYIIAVALGLAFMLGLIKSSMKGLSILLMLGGLAFMTFVSGQWLYEFVVNNRATELVYTAGFAPPYSINLQMGMAEAFLTLIINLIGFLGGVYLIESLKKTGISSMLILLVFIMSMNVIVMTRDIFNLFVFMEISSIATAGLVLMDKKRTAFQAGMKYLIATGIVSGIFLIGIIFSYYYSGSLNIDDLIASNIMGLKGGSIAIFLIYVSILLEMKPFPANGWGIDLYTAANPGIGALVSAASASAGLFVLYKLLPLGGAEWLNYIALIGGITFIGSNLMGTKQDNPNRLLGYSSIGQIGLLVTIIGLKPYLGDKFEFIAITILITHYLAKAGLFWLSGIIKKQNINDWAVLRRRPVLMVLFGTFVFALIGFPPFPSFLGKWELVMQLSASGQFAWMALVLIGSFLEGIYLFKWFSNALKLDNTNLPEIKVSFNQCIPPVIFGLAIYGLGYYAGTMTEIASGIKYLPLLFIAFIALIDFLPVWVKNTISMVGVIIYALFIFPDLEGDLIRQIFLGIFLGGAVITLFSGYYQKGKRVGFYPMALAMFAGLTMLLTATNLFEILYGWELMTIGSYFLLIRGKKSLPHGYSYMMFSLGGSYAMMFGFALAFASNGYIDIHALSEITVYPTLAYSLILLGFMTKTASFGLHTWLPGAHGEAVADIHFMASAILLKAGVFGIILVLLEMGTEIYYAQNILYVLGWIGAISALIGNLAAVFQDSAKRLLAWSSIGQLGYIVFGFALMSHLGWLTGFFYTITHFMYKGVLFLIIGGIALKLGTPLMYKMGGLIKRMPFSFVAVLIAIITLGGIPPLVGFTGKWLFYNAVIEKGWYFQGAVIFFSGIIAFLYLFKLIHSIFLGQLKDNHRNVTEVSIWILIPAYFLLIGIMVISAFPKYLLQPIGDMLAIHFPNTDAIRWEGTKAITALGYWDGTTIMIVVMTAFALLLGWLVLMSKKIKKIGQFNIVFAAERPYRPETTHVSYNIYAGYKKALGFLVTPVVDVFWEGMSNLLLEFAGWLRRIYSGNMQNYALHVVLFIVVFYLIAVGGF